jgi:hypothetical protein
MSVRNVAGPAYLARWARAASLVAFLVGTVIFGAMLSAYKPTVCPGYAVAKSRDVGLGVSKHVEVLRPSP